MSIGILDIGIGNIGSLKQALIVQGWDPVTVKTKHEFSNLTHLIIPGVGAFNSFMSRISEVGVVEPILDFANQGYPLLGICLGMQILAENGTEGGYSRGLGLIAGQIKLLTALHDVRVPHVGWNESVQKQQHPLFVDIRADVDFYFVHSYKFITRNPKDVFAETFHGELFPSIVGKNNIVGVQFHPEKSQANGLKLLDNFCLWNGVC